ncbi:MAG: hypothetical protein V4736_08210 [Bdellovibrionota bacterium]
MARHDMNREKRLHELMEEFQKKTPDQNKIKNLFNEFKLAYSSDPVDQMMTVLAACTEVKRNVNEVDQP